MELKDYHSDLSYSFSGKNNVYKAFSGTPKEELDKKLAQSEIYSKYHVFRKSPTSPTYVHHKRQLFQADLAFWTLDHQVEANQGYKYLLLIIDCFTKRIWLYPLKDKKCASVHRAFENLLQTIDELPKNFQTDRGAEFLCADFAQLLKSYNINHYITDSDKKAAMAERAIRTIKDWLQKMMDEENTHSWTSLLPKVMRKYSRTEHSTIKMSPNNAELEKYQDKLRKNYNIKWSKFKAEKKSKFKINDFVRIAGLKQKFRRSWYQPFSDEFFKIYRIQKPLKRGIQGGSPLLRSRYYLKDLQGNKLKRDPAWWAHELSLFIPSVNDTYKVDRIIKTRTRGNKVEHFVSWIGWPESYNQWINARQLENI